jgi:hypothetical protein
MKERLHANPVIVIKEHHHSVELLLPIVKSNTNFFKTLSPLEECFVQRRSTVHPFRHIFKLQTIFQRLKHVKVPFVQVLLKSLPFI